MSLHLVVQNLIKGMVKDVSKSCTGMGMLALVVDEHSTKIMSSCCSMYDILDEGISLAVPIEKAREPLPHMDALYFLSPCQSSVEALIQDFEEAPQYKNVHIYFTTRLSDELFGKLSEAKVGQRIKTLRELNMDYLAPENNLFLLPPTASDDNEPKDAFKMLFSPTCQDSRSDSLKKDAAGIASVCATLNEFPTIRYPTGFPIAKELAELVQSELEALAAVNPEFKAASKESVLLIVDRTFDTLAPVLHEFTLQAMAYDLLAEDITSRGYKFEVDTANGVKEDKVATLDDSDPLWVKLRYEHIANAQEWLVNDFNEFMREHRKSEHTKQTSTNSNNENIKAMTTVLKQLPQFQEQKAKYSLHIDLAHNCMSTFNKEQLNTIAMLEQDMSVQETKDNKTTLKSLFALLENSDVSVENKVRLLLVYFATHSSYTPADKRKLIQAASLGNQKGVLDNLTHVTSEVDRFSKKKKKKKSKKNKRADDVPFELSRYVPLLKSTLVAILEDTLSEDDAPYVSPPSKTTKASKKTSTVKSRKSLRKKEESNWANKKKGNEQMYQGPRVLVFVAGGATYSEIRVAAEITEKYKQQVLIGCEKEPLTPKKYISLVNTLLQ